MHRVDADGNVSGLFTDGVPGSVVATKVDASWLNDMQENLIALLTAASITPVAGTYTQVRDAILALVNQAPSYTTFTGATGYDFSSGSYFAHCWKDRAGFVHLEAYGHVSGSPVLNDCFTTGFPSGMNPISGGYAAIPISALEGVAGSLPSLLSAMVNTGGVVLNTIPASGHNIFLSGTWYGHT